jgi:hypothetical protein
MKAIEAFNGPYGMWQVEGTTRDWNDAMVVYTWLGVMPGSSGFQVVHARNRPRQILCVTSFEDNHEDDDWLTAYIKRDNPESEQAAQWLLDFAYACR